MFYFIFLNYFNILILKIFFKNKKYYFNIFFNKKYFKNNHNYTPEKHLNPKACPPLAAFQTLQLSFH
jgi:hypothetical protein